MALKATEIISAQVVLRAASGKAPDAQITAETLSQYLPASEAAAQARAAFSAAGFEVGPLVANNFSITAPAAAFERVFQTKLRYNARGALQNVLADDSAQAELPLKKLPVALSRHVAAVTFTPPPDFGPQRFDY